MPAIVTSAAIHGVDAELIMVEVDISPGLPSMTVVGLPDTAVQESRERIRSAIRNSGFEFPMRRITVNLSPADQRKEGSGFDLPIAVAVLLASKQIADVFDSCIMVGELTLRGECRPVPGGIAFAECARRSKKTIIIPRDCGPEVALVDGTAFLTISSLGELARRVEQSLRPELAPPAVSIGKKSLTIWPTIRGQAAAKRAAMITAAGGHNLLMVGPPGTGKTMIAEGLVELLADLSDQAALEVTKIASVANIRRPSDPLQRRPPFRHPHHSASVASLIGGGRVPRPGELTLAHRGILFLDEFPEWRREHLEALRQPLENGTVSVNRVAGSVEFPAAVMLIAAMNPCPCGYARDRTRVCSCSPTAIQRYTRRISGPILDRFDLSVTLARVETAELRRHEVVDPRPHIQQAWQRSVARNGGQPNARVRGLQLRRITDLTADASEFFIQALDRFQLSLRAHDRVLRVARTIADLADVDKIGVSHLAEAIQYRPPFTLDEPRRMTTG